MLVEDLLPGYSSGKTLVDFSDSWSKPSSGQRLAVNGKKIMVVGDARDVVNRKDTLPLQADSAVLRISMAPSSNSGYGPRYLKSLAWKSTRAHTCAGLPPPQTNRSRWTDLGANKNCAPPDPINLSYVPRMWRPHQRVASTASVADVSTSAQHTRPATAGLTTTLRVPQVSRAASAHVRGP